MLQQQIETNLFTSELKFIKRRLKAIWVNFF